MTPEDGEDLPFHKVITHFQQLILNSEDTPILIDGLPLDWKDINNWVQKNGPPTILNLKCDEKELIRRARKKAEGDLNAEVGEEEAAKAKEGIAKNIEWTDQFTSRCTNTTLFQIDFNQQMILAEKLLDEVLRPRVFLVQNNPTTLYQNIAIRYGVGFFDLRKSAVQEISTAVRKGHFRDIILCNYMQDIYNLVCEDFYEIEKHIGCIKYLGVWNSEPTESKEEELKLEPPPKEEKPKPAEGEEGEAPPP